ncbi:hypothetical protein BS47DRAFT_1409249 [Hydnum rufescens UP504]|uniref:DUF4110 domain-containing protein n=1 Tax=Hydnum rufescens UP504 TaxID=1448309 RepID=A0A9P6ARC6_9AGAM|nr:hypothetical protein BS47DRAFT_1409249 [Hydnum rufescens UP504]
MGKKPNGKTAVKEAKKVKAAQKVARKETKTQQKKKTKVGADAEDEDNDLERSLNMKIEWEEKHRVTEEIVEGPPTRRANASLTADPGGNHIWCIGGEYFSSDGKAHFYNDVYRYTPDKDEWRRFVSATCPGPRSAHAVVPSPAGGGKLFLCGGEFSSLHQTTFHHYRDLWMFDISTKSWERIETKVRPSARSGHRMALWKHYVVLFGGFYDPGVRTQYLNDLWVFDTQEYTWTQVVLRDTDRRPSPRSGFSFIPSGDGIVLHGGYCKEYVKGKRVQGVALEDTWFLKMSMNLKELKWERRKKTGYAPSVRSGCTMALWAARDIGILFGGVKDDDQSEETLVSEFYNDLYGYHTIGNGKWTSMMLRKKKPNQGRKQTRAAPTRAVDVRPPPSHHSEDEGGEGGSDADVERQVAAVGKEQPKKAPRNNTEPEEHVLPLPRYNAMLAVLRNTLYIYGGILERGSQEITLDDFWCIALDKMETYVCLKPLETDVSAIGDESSSDDGDDSDDSEGSDNAQEEDEEAGDPEQEAEDERHRQQRAADLAADQEEVEKAALRVRAADFLNASKTINPVEALSTPLPGETLAIFYARTREYWIQQAHTSSDNRGKMLRRDGFALASERYQSYKPILDEVETILAEAGLDAEEMKQVRGGGDGALGSGSRNRR